MITFYLQELAITKADFFQLPPERAGPVYAEYKNVWQNLDSSWDLFEIAELT